MTQEGMHRSSGKRTGPLSGYIDSMTTDMHDMRKHVIYCLETDRLLVMVPKVLAQLRPVKLRDMFSEERGHS